MSLESRKLLTIVTEAALEHELTTELQRLGAHGYTVTDARGRGGRGVRNASWSMSANIRIEAQDGSVVEGVTDENAQFLVEGIPRGVTRPAGSERSGRP